MERADVIVIGSGAGGGAMAWALASRGVDVLVLEAGPEFNPSKDYLTARPEWESKLFPHKEGSFGRHTHGPMQELFSEFDNIRSWDIEMGHLNDGNHRHFERYEHVRGVGGTTLAYTAEAHRMHPRAMLMKSRFGVGADWPITYDELEPYYVKAEQMTGVSGRGDNDQRARSAPYPLPPHAISYASKKVIDGLNKLGLTYEMNPVAILSAPYDDRPACNYCSACTRGCLIGDKGSVDVTFIRKARATGKCRVKADSSVVRIEAGPGDQVKGIVFANSKGALERAEAGAIVVSCGAIETPRLLLASEDATYCPDGLANESGQVGRNLMETVSWSSSALHPDPIGSHRGIPADIIIWDYNAPDAIDGLIGGCRFTPAATATGLMGPSNYARRAISGFGREHRKRLKEYFGRILNMASIGESIPNAKTFVELDPSEKDNNGIALAKINSYLDSMEIKRIAFMAETCRNILRASGATELVEEYGSYDFFNSSHVFGTCRMGANADDSVVDSTLRSHRWKNLYIVDASVMPSTGGGESPSLSAEALAIRTAEIITS